MKKKRKGLKIFLIVLLAIVVIGGCVGFYFYKFHVFKTLRVCVSETDSSDSEVLCNSKEDCVSYFEGTEEYLEQQEVLNNAPGFVQDKMEEVLDYYVYCEETCKTKTTRGLTMEEMESTEPCAENETEFLLEIRGKEGWEILKWLKKAGKL